jgi:hypothetical protein
LDFGSSRSLFLFFGLLDLPVLLLFFLVVFRIVHNGSEHLVHEIVTSGKKLILGFFLLDEFRVDHGDWLEFALAFVDRFSVFHVFLLVFLVKISSGFFEGFLVRFLDDKVFFVGLGGPSAEFWFVVVRLVSVLVNRAFSEVSRLTKFLDF